MVLMQRFVKYSGRWCRDCALSQFRRAQSRTLLYGWWGLISFFANIAAVVQNIGGYRKASALPTPAGRTRAPLPQRGSVFVSPGFGVVAAVLALLVATKLF
jgi:hypothetical protein